MSLRIDAAGPACTVQDLGRPGLSDLGVGRSGAADRGGLVEANRLAGNDDGAAALEVTLGGLRLTALISCTIAIGGAAVPVTVRGAAGTRTAGRLVELSAGEQVRLGRPPDGLRTYLAVRGGFDVDPVLGSRSTDTLSGIGPPAVTAGDQLAIGEAFRPGAAMEPPTRSDPDYVATPRVSTLDVMLGPRDDWFTERALETLAGAEWTVGRDTDRVGMHLDGPILERRIRAELSSEGMVCGAIQVPASGHPVVFLADHPVTGGYPVIAVLTTSAIDMAAQLRPGRTVRLRVLPHPALTRP